MDQYMINLTTEDEEILRIITEHTDRTFIEIMQQTGLSRVQISHSLRVLIQHGFVRQKEDDIEHDWLYIRTNRCVDCGQRDCVCSHVDE